MSQTIRRARPVRNMVSSIANGVADTVPTAVSAIQSSVLAIKQVADIVNINLETAIIEERAEALLTLKSLQSDFNLTQEELTLVTQGSTYANFVVPTKG